MSTVLPCEKMHRSFYVLLLLILSVSACKQERVESDCDLSPGLYELSNFPIGMAVDLNFLDFDLEYERLLNQQFNQITPENIFKPSYLQPSEGQFYFNDADRLVAYSESRNKMLHGHTLLWHKQLPQWMEDFQGSKSEWENILKTHIQTIVAHFKGKVRAWDVVNEAFDEDGSLRESIWKKNIGIGYIEKAFEYAHAADPDALLFLNDYNLSISPQKRKALLSMVEDFQRRGVPIDGIGLQMHINIAFPSDPEIGACLQEVAKSGLVLHLSEVDIAVNPYSRDIDFNSNLAQRQAKKMAFLVRAFQSLPKHQQYGISFWGLSDLDSWIPSYFGRKDYPLLFDRNYSAKPMYCQLKALLPE